MLKLRPIMYSWKESRDDRGHLGLLAQEVERVIPEVVDRPNDPKAPLGLKYDGFIPVLIKAIQE